MGVCRPGTGICGGQTPEDNRFAAGGMFATRQITGHYTEGGVIHSATQLTVKYAAVRQYFSRCIGPGYMAHSSPVRACGRQPQDVCAVLFIERLRLLPLCSHWGYVELRLCPLSNPSTSAEKAELSEECLRAHRLKLVGGGGYKQWINYGAGGSRFVVRSTWRLPAGVTCERCVLQVPRCPVPCQFRSKPERICWQTLIPW